MSNEEKLDQAFWIYQDEENRFWCSECIDKAVEDFKDEVKNNPELLEEIGGLEEIDNIGYMMDCACVSEENYPAYCNTCGKELCSYKEGVDC